MTEIDEVIAEYDRIVRTNVTPTYNAIAEVYEDRDGEVVYEVFATAADLGFVLTDGDRDALQDATDAYRLSLRSAS